MSSIADPARESIIGPPFLHLVDIDGHDVPLTERFDGPEPDRSDPENWGPEWDSWFWTITDPTEVAELESLEAERLADLALEVDAPRPIRGGSPTPTPADLQDLDAWLATVDRPYPPADQVEDGMAFPATRPDWTPEPARDRHSVEALQSIAVLLASYGRGV